MKDREFPPDLQYLIGRFLSKLGDKIANAENDDPSIDAEVLWLDALSWPFTSEDDKFKDAWGRLHANTGENLSAQEIIELRFEEIRLIIDVLVRNQVIYKMPPKHDADAADYLAEDDLSRPETGD